MATPPSWAADWSFRPPSSRPIGVRAPATITDPDMSGPPAVRGTAPVEVTHARRGRARPRSPHVVRKSSQAVVRPSAAGEHGRMAPTDDLPGHLFTAIDH